MRSEPAEQQCHAAAARAQGRKTENQFTVTRGFWLRSRRLRIATSCWNAAFGVLCDLEHRAPACPGLQLDLLVTGRREGSSWETASGGTI
jgi:hypothetical protein